MWNGQYNPADPYGQMLQGMQMDNGSSAQAYSQQLLDAAMRRQQQEDEEQQSSFNTSSNDLMDQFMNSGTAAPTSTLPASAMGGGTLQASMSAPLAQAAPLASQTGIGGGAVVGPMSQAPVAGVSMAPGGTAGATMGGMAAPAAAAPVGAGTGGVVGAGGAGAAGAGAGAGAGTAAAGAGTAAGAGALGMAALIAAPIMAGLGAAQWTNNTHDDVNWGTHFTDPNKAQGALGENVEDISTRWFGDNQFGNDIGSALSSPQKILFPSSPGEFVEGIGDTLFINQATEGLGNLWRGLGDLF